MMALLRRLIYALGFRPKYPSIWYSPSRDLTESFKRSFQMAEDPWLKIDKLAGLNRDEDGIGRLSLNGVEDLANALSALPPHILERDECNGAALCGKTECQLSSLNQFEMMRIVTEQTPRDCVKEWRERVGDTSEQWYREQTGG